MGVEGGAGEIATVDLQRILDTKVSAGKDVVRERYLGVTERQLLILRTPARLVVAVTHFTVQPVVGLGLPTVWQLRLVAVLMRAS